jgi:hypothetical protein
VTGRWSGGALTLAATASIVVAGAGPATAGPTITSEPFHLTQPEDMCFGQEVPVTYDGEFLTTELTTRSGQAGSWTRFVGRLSWQQEGVSFTARATTGFAAPPGGRTSTFYFVAVGRGTDGTRVHVLEVVHARLSAEGDADVLVDIERVDCH